VHGQLVPHYTCYPLEILKEVYSEKFEGMEINMAETLPHNKKVLIKGYELGNIIADLLQNAIRLTGKNKFRGKISVTEDQGNIIMDVEDNGPGIPLRYRRKIFEKGFTTNPDGGGFGLYYAKQILAKYDGNIRLLKTVSGEGSVFRIILKQINYE
jgi:signal transduction histidine kinase